MASLEEAKRVLAEALKNEQAAETNCQLILEELAVNGFHDVIDQIRHDERRHQQMVQDLIDMLG